MEMRIFTFGLESDGHIIPGLLKLFPYDMDQAVDSLKKSFTFDLTNAIDFLISCDSSEVNEMTDVTLISLESMFRVKMYEVQSFLDRKITWDCIDDLEDLKKSFVSVNYAKFTSLRDKFLHWFQKSNLSDYYEEK